MREGRIAEARVRLNATPESLRGWEWQHLMSRTQEFVREFQTASKVVVGIDVSSDGRTLFAASADRAPQEGGSEGVFVQAWDLEDGKEMNRGAIKGSPIVRLIDGGTKAIFSRQRANGFTIVVVQSGEVLWETGDLDTLRKDKDRYHVLREPSGGDEIALVDGRHHLWRSQTHSALALRGHTTAHPFVISSDGRTIALARRLPLDFGVWDAVTGEEKFSRTRTSGQSFALILDTVRNRLFSVGSDGSLRVWNATTGSPVDWHQVQAHEGAFSAAISANGHAIATYGGDGAIRVWDTTSGEQRAKYGAAPGYGGSIKFLPGGAQFATGSATGRVHVWDAAPGESADVLRGHSDYVYPVAFSPDGRRFASGGWDGRLIIWDAESGEQIAALNYDTAERDVVYELAFSSDGARLSLTHHRSGSLIAHNVLDVVIIDAETGAERARIPGRLSNFNPTGDRIFITSWENLKAQKPYNLTLTTRDVGSLESISTKTISVKPKRQRRAPVFHPDGSLVAVAGPQNTIMLLDASTLEKRGRLVGHDANVTGIAFSPDGLRLAAGAADGTARVWNVATHECLGVLRGHIGELFGVAYSPDAKRIATGGRDTTIRIWDAETLTELVQLRGHEKYVWSVAFSPDGKSLISGSGDTTVRIWDTKPPHVRIRAKRERKRLVGDLQPMVAGLFERLKDASKVAAYLKADTSMNVRRREIALQLVLARSIEMLNANHADPDQ